MQDVLILSVSKHTSFWYSKCDAHFVWILISKKVEIHLLFSLLLHIVFVCVADVDGQLYQMLLQSFKLSYLLVFYCPLYMLNHVSGLYVVFRTISYF